MGRFRKVDTRENFTRKRHDWPPRKGRYSTSPAGPPPLSPRPCGCSAGRPVAAGAPLSASPDPGRRYRPGLPSFCRNRQPLVVPRQSRGVPGGNDALNRSDNETIRPRVEKPGHRYFSFLVNLRGVFSSLSVTVRPLVSYRKTETDAGCDHQRGRIHL